MMPWLVLDDFVCKRRPWSDERHVTTQDVPQLRELVKTGLPQDATDRRNPWVISDFEQLVGPSFAGDAAGLDERADKFVVDLVVGVRVHGTELQHRERLHHLP